MTSSTSSHKLFNDSDMAQMHFIISQFSSFIKTLKQSEKRKSIKFANVSDRSFWKSFLIACTSSEVIADRIESIWSSILKNLVKGDACGFPQHLENQRTCKYHARVLFCFKKSGEDLFELLRYPINNDTPAYEDFWPFCLGRFMRIVLPYRSLFPSGENYFKMWDDVGRIIQALWFHARSEAFALTASNEGVCLFKKHYRKHETAFEALTNKYRSVTPSASHFSLKDDEQSDMDWQNDEDRKQTTASKSVEKLGEGKATSEHHEARKRSLSSARSNETLPHAAKRAKSSDKVTDPHKVKSLGKVKRSDSNLTRNVSQTNGSTGKSPSRKVSFALEQPHKSREELEKENCDLQAEVDDWKDVLMQNGEEFQSALDLVRSQAQLQVQQRDATIAALQAEVRELRANRREMMENLSHEMSSRMSRDERDLENLSTTVRPMNITAELAQMQSSDWLDAKLWLDERRQVAEVKKFKLLMSIIKESYRRAELMFTAVKAGVRNEVLKAVGQMGGSAANDVTELNVALARFFKQHTANMQFASQVQSVLKKAFTNDHADVLKSEEMTSFARSCLLIGWKMVLQRPPMTYVFPERGDVFDELRHELWIGSMDASESSAKILFSVFPAVKHGDQQLSKAKVFLGHV